MSKSKCIRKAASLLLALAMASGVEASVLAPSFAEQEPEPGEPPAAATPIYRDTGYSFEERAADLVARMTLQQKTQQMVSSKSTAIAAGDDAAGTIGTGVRTYGWWSEALHGYASNGLNDRSNPTGIQNATSYPISYSMGQSWDPELMWRVASASGDEIRELAPGNDSNLNFYSPTVNLSRDPRWGRNTESFGEDPLHSAKMAAQFVNGLQGMDMDGNAIDPNGYYKASATIKHYFANNSEFNRLQGVSFLTEKESREYYSAVYRNIIKYTNPSAVMSAYNRINIKDAAYSPFEEMPGGINHYTLDTMLRQTFGFDGYVTGDCDSVNVAYQGNGTAGTSPTQGASGYSGVGHGWRTPAFKWYGADSDTAAAGTAAITVANNVAWAVMGGGNLECNQGVASGKNYELQLPNADSPLSTPLGNYTEQAVDVAVVKLMEARLRFGEWDDKAVYAAAPSETETSRVTWYDQAKARVRSYGLQLPTGAVSMVSTATAATMTPERIALVDEAAGKSIVLLKNDKVEGVNGGQPLLPLTFPESGEFSVGVYGTMRSSVVLGLYSSSRGSAGSAKQLSPVNGIKAAVSEKFGDRVSVVDRGATSNADAANDDYVIAVVGDIGTSVASEQNDRANFALKAADITLIKELYALNKKVIVVVITSCPIGEANATDNVYDSMPSLLYSAYLGDRPGAGIGDIIVGNVNPSARTNSVWYPISSVANPNPDVSSPSDSLNQVKSYRLSPGADGPWQSPFGAAYAPLAPFTFAGNNRGRTYMYYNGKDEQAVRFPLGYGLSYTTFEYGDPQVSVNGAPQRAGVVSVTPNDKVDYTFTVKNTGAVAGSDVAQLYVKTPADLVAADSTYAIKRLKDFHKTKELAPGASETVTLSVEVPDLAFWSAANKKFELAQDTGSNYYALQVSRSSADSGAYEGQDYGVQLSADMHIAGAAAWDPKVSVVSFKPNTPADAANDVPQRLIYGIGDTVLPNPTVSMANDVLYGYINRLYSSADAQRYPIPANITLTYSSNRPSVVEVSPSSGAVTAMAAGVATITGTAYDSITGSSASAEFVVYVQEPVATLDDVAMASFTYGEEIFDAVEGVYEYDVSVPKSKTSISAADFAAGNIAAAYPDKADVSVSFEPADGAVGDGAPCKATVTVTSKVLGAELSQTYIVNFGHLTVGAISNINYMGFNSTAPVRFGDGTTSYVMIQAFYRDGKLVRVNSAKIKPVEKHKSDAVSVKTEDIVDMDGLTVKVFLWDDALAPLVPASSEWTGID
jgi:beta-glucosidase